MIVTIAIILIIGQTIFMSNAIPALVEVKENRPNAYFNRWVLVFSGFCSLIVLIGFMVVLLEINEKSQPLHKFEIITEPVYKLVK